MSRFRFTYILIRSYLTPQLFAFLILAIACAYSITAVRSEGIKRDKAFAVFREERADQIVSTLARGSVTGCIAANAVTLGTHRVVAGSYNAGTKSIDQLVTEGTLTHVQRQRILIDSRLQTISYLNDLPYKDCKKSANRYVNQIVNLKTRAAIGTEITKDVHEALIARSAKEPKLITVGG